MNRPIVAALLASTLAMSSAPAAAGVAEQATAQHYQACQAKHRGMADVRAEREAVYECAATAAAAASVIAPAIVDACRAEFKSLEGRAYRTWRCALLGQFGPRMDERDWRITVEDVCTARVSIAGHRFERQKSQCLIEALLEQRKVPAARQQACRKPSTGNPTTEADDRFRCLSAPSGG